MINVLHLYYDLLNLYGENANTRSIKYNLELNKIKVNIDLKSLNDEIDFNKYDLIYIGSGSEDNMKLALFSERVNNKQSFETVPAKLKDKVKIILIEKSFQFEEE